MRLPKLTRFPSTWTEELRNLVVLEFGARRNTLDGRLCITLADRRLSVRSLVKRIRTIERAEGLERLEAAR